MILAYKCRIPKLPIPEAVLKVKGSDIMTSEVEDAPVALKYGSCLDWMSCEWAVPHRDELFEDSYFIILAVKSKHCLGTEAYCDPDLEIRRGDLFLIDPACLHWLFPRCMYPPHRQIRATKFIALQWVVPRNTWKRTAKKIIERLKGITHVLD